MTDLTNLEWLSGPKWREGFYDNREICDGLTMSARGAKGRQGSQ